VTNVLLLTSHPLAPPWDSADKQLAMSLAHRLERRYRFTVLGRAGHPSDLPSSRRIPIWSRHGRPGLVERTQVALAGLAVELTVDLVHVVLTIGPGFSRLSSLRRRLPSTVRRPVIHTVPGIRDRTDVDRSHPLGLTVALSETTASRLRGAGFSDVRVLPPGIPLQRWPFVEKTRRDPRLILFAGHYDPDAGAEDAIRGVAAATHRERPLTLVLAMRTRLGQNAARQHERLNAVARAAGLADFELRGHVSDMASLIRSSSLVLFPARSLAGKADIPLVVLEAMASGRPVIVSDVPQFAPLGHGVTRVCVGDPAALGKAIGLLLDRRERWHGQAREGRAIVEAQFSDEVMASRYAELYEEALAMGARSHR
jgi:glycosyltransferase involved in cell wall biosynthesis